MTTHHVRAAESQDIEAIRSIVGATLFPGELLDDMMAPYLEGGAAERWFVSETSAVVVGVAFVIPEPMTQGTWNLKAIGVQPDWQGRGVGRALMSHVEVELRADGERLLIVDTSSDEAQETARAFYLALGYASEAVIRDFWGPGGDKVTFRKAL